MVHTPFLLQKSMTFSWLFQDILTIFYDQILGRHIQVLHRILSEKTMFSLPWMVFIITTIIWFTKCHFTCYQAVWKHVLKYRYRVCATTEWKVSFYHVESPQYFGFDDICGGNRFFHNVSWSTCICNFLWLGRLKAIW